MGEKDHRKSIWIYTEIVLLRRRLICRFILIRSRPVLMEQGSGRKELLRGYYAAITAMDNQVGLILDLLDELGLQQDTLIVLLRTTE